MLIFQLTLVVFNLTLLFLGSLIIQAGVREWYIEKYKEGDTWIDFCMKNNWSIIKGILYEMFFLDLFTCRECGKINRHGKMCKECKEEYIKEQI